MLPNKAPGVFIFICLQKAKKAKPNATPSVDVKVAEAQIAESFRPDPKADYWQDELSKLISLMEAEASRPPADDSPAERQAHIQRPCLLHIVQVLVDDRADFQVLEGESVLLN